LDENGCTVENDMADEASTNRTLTNRLFNGNTREANYV